MEREPIDWSDRQARRTARLQAIGVWADGSSSTVLVSNLSYDGCEMQSNRGFEQGEVVRLALPGRGRIQAQIRWVKDNRAGAKFLTGDSVRDQRRARLGI
jgi:hypothetical protein